MSFERKILESFSVCSDDWEWGEPMADRYSTIPYREIVEVMSIKPSTEAMSKFHVLIRIPRLLNRTVFIDAGFVFTPSEMVQLSKLKKKNLQRWFNGVKHGDPYGI